MTRQPGGTPRLHLQALFSTGVTAPLTDGQLLERFATAEGAAAEMAFATLVERHGPMVFRACRGILNDEHEAHDAFQATFLVLLRKANTLWVRDSLGPWLHRVACRAAARTRVEAQRRRAHERRAGERAEHPGDAHGTGELAALVHEEVDRLPDRYRVPIVLCELQGRTYAEAAQHLRCPIGTVRSRLARGREQLRHRLTRRGLAPSATALGAALVPDTASAALPATLAQSITHYARCTLAGGALTAGEVPASVLAITEGVLSMIVLGRRTLVAATLLTAVGLAVGAGVLAQQAPEKPAPAPGQAAAAERDDRWVARLPGGGTLEVLGVSTYPAGPKTWWRPDGSPLAEPPCDSPPRTLGGDFEYRVLAARVSGVPADAERGWTVKGARGTASAAARKDGKALPGVSTKLVGLPAGLDLCTVEFYAATGPWQTLGTFSGKGSEAVGSGSGPSYIFGTPLADKNETILTVSHDIADRSMRIVAVDRDGQERRPVRTEGSGANNFHQTTVRFNLAPEAIREYRLQTRPYQRVDIPGIVASSAGTR